MIGIVIVAHGGLAREYLSAVEHVVGRQNGIRAISIEPDHDRSLKQTEICAAADSVCFAVAHFAWEKLASNCKEIAKLQLLRNVRPARPNAASRASRLMAFTAACSAAARAREASAEL